MFTCVLAFDRTSHVEFDVVYDKPRLPRLEPKNLRYTDLTQAST